MITWTLIHSGSCLEIVQPEKEREFLSPAERLRLAGFRFPRRRTEWLLGRWTAKMLYLGSAGMDAGLANLIEVRNRPDGSPDLWGQEGERIPGCISISHRADYAAAAWSEDDTVQVGIDLEKVEQRSPSFLDDYFTPDEQNQAMRLFEPERSLWITLAWSAKEAVLKAVRRGLNVDTRCLTVGLQDGHLPRLHDHWSALTVCTSIAGDQPLQLLWKSQDDLVITLAVLGNVPNELKFVSLA